MMRVNTTSGTTPDEHIVDVMTQLARADRAHRVIVAGSSPGLLGALSRRGFLHVASTRSGLIPCGQYQVALADGHGMSADALEATLAWLIRFLGRDGALVVWVSRERSGANRQLRLVLQKLGFSIEAGTCRDDGMAVCARRTQPTLAARAA